MHALLKAVISITLILVALVSGVFAKKPLTFTTIDVPGATDTAAFGINAAGHIVGLYLDSSGTQHGYLFAKGTFTTIDPPGATEVVHSM